MRIFSHLFTILFISTAVNAEVKLSYSASSDYDDQYEISLTLEDAKALQSVFGKKNIESKHFIQSISCASITNCKIKVRAEMYSKNYCTQVNCGDDKFRTNYGADITALIDKMVSDDDRGLLAPVQDWYFHSEHDHVKAYKKIYEAMEKSNSKWVKEDILNEEIRLQLQTSAYDLQCTKFKNPEKKKQVDSFIPHGPILASHSFKKTHACRLFVFTKITKNTKPTFVVKPNGFEVKLSGLLNGQLVPVAGADFYLGGDFHGYFRPKAAIYYIPKVQTDEQGVAKFTKTYSYWHNDVITYNSSSFAVASGKNILPASIASLGLQEITGCKKTLSS